MRQWFMVLTAVAAGTFVAERALPEVAVLAGAAVVAAGFEELRRWRREVRAEKREARREAGRDADSV